MSAMPTISATQASEMLSRLSTTEMEVTSIRLERTLKEKLKDLSGNRGYQALIRDILWDYVQLKSQSAQTLLAPSDIRATFTATAQQAETCAMTGRAIPPQTEMLLGLTLGGQCVPISRDAL
jgi:hypothetical protein